MQKISNRLYLLFVLMSFVFGVFGLTSCSEGNKTSLKLLFEQNEYQLEVGEQIEVEPIIKNASEEPLYLVWKSYNTSVVSINDGVLEGVGVGKTEVKVFISGNTNVYATLTVKVTAKNQIPVAKFNEVPATLYVGDELQLTYELANAENECEFVYQSLTDAATVDQTGLIKVLEEGYALVTVKVTDKVTGQYVNYNFSFEVLTNYDITYVLDEGINNEENPSFYIANQKDVVLQNPEKYGYNFLGWYEDEEFTKPISVIDVDRKENITLYANWELAGYTITYNVNGGTLPSDAKIGYLFGDEYKLPIPTKLSDDKPEFQGYLFKGWYDNENLEGEPVTKILPTEAENKEYYAKWVDSILLEVEEPIDGATYKIAMYHKTQQNWLWMTETMSGYYVATTTDYHKSINVTLISVTNGYNLKIIDSGTYINVVASGTYNNIKFQNSASSVWTFNEDYNTLTTKTSNGTLFMGTYGSNYTFGASYTSYLTNSTNYISHLFEEVEYTDEVKAQLSLNKVEVDERHSKDYELPMYENIEWKLKEEYAAATIENGVLKINRPAYGENDAIVTLVATCTINDVSFSKEFDVDILAYSDIEEVFVIDTAKTYKLGFYRDNVSVKGYYFVTGNIVNNYYGEAVLSKFDSADIKIIEVTGGYQIKLINGEKEQYLELIQSGNYTNIKYLSSPTSFVWSFNEEYNVFTYKFGNVEYFIGTKGTYTTLEPYAMSYITTNYIAHLYDVTITENDIKTYLNNLNVSSTMENEYTLPKCSNVVWSLKEDYEGVTLNDYVLTAPQKDAEYEILVIATYGETEINKEFQITVKPKKQSGGESSEEPVTVTLTISELGMENAAVFSSYNMDEVITLSANKGSGSSNPAYYTSGYALRIYGKNVFTISAADGYEITSVVITAPTGSNGISNTTCTITNATAIGLGTASIVLTPIDGTSDILLTNPNSSGNFRIQAISVTYVKK